jgi:hypothetical protein
MFMRAKKKFVARVQYKDANGGFVERHIKVAEEWVAKEAGFADDVINHVLALKDLERIIQVNLLRERFARSH